MKKIIWIIFAVQKCKMALILSIDTAAEKAVVCLGKDEKVISFFENTEQKNHASFLQPAIEQMMKEAGICLFQLDAIAVSYGPGSYTGLRVGLASAKGIAYALNKPLITLNTLEVMAQNAIQEKKETKMLYCPMIDARRMEIFTGIYNVSLTNLYQPCALVLDEKSFDDILNANEILFFGSGMQKWKTLVNNKNALFGTLTSLHQGLNFLAMKKFYEKDFADIAYSEPFYIKSFYTKKQEK